jgi:hypothetical protein
LILIKIIRAEALRGGQIILFNCIKFSLIHLYQILSKTAAEVNPYQENISSEIKAA